MPNFVQARALRPATQLDRKTINRYFKIFRATCSLFMDGLSEVQKMVGGSNKTVEMDQGSIPKGWDVRGDAANGDEEKADGDVNQNSYLAVCARDGARPGKCHIFEINNTEPATANYYAYHFIAPSLV